MRKPLTLKVGDRVRVGRAHGYIAGMGTKGKTMSRSGYSDDYGSYSEVMLYRGTVDRATRGKRGQKFLRDLVAALDAMPEKRLIAHDLENAEGVCALGALGKQKGVEFPELDPEDDYGDNGRRLAPIFDIAPSLANEVMYMNDDRNENATPEERWRRMRAWAAMQIVPTDAEIGHVEVAG